MLASKLKPFIERYEEISALLIKPEILNDIKRITELSKEQSDLEKLVQKSKQYLQNLQSIEENKSLLDDKELGDLAKEEIKEAEAQNQELESEIKVLLLPKDPNDEKNIYLELRAGTGGDEAGIFVGDLFKAYVRYAESKGWKVEIISSNENNFGGYKEVIALIKGKGAYSRLKYEGGTHRVQRVPETESQGRIHTSAITVAIMPEVDDVEVVINPNDFVISYGREGNVIDYEIPNIPDLKLSPSSSITYIPADNGYLQINIVLTHPNFTDETYSFMINCPVNYVY